MFVLTIPLAAVSALHINCFIYIHSGIVYFVFNSAAAPAPGFTLALSALICIVFQVGGDPNLTMQMERAFRRELEDLSIPPELIMWMEGQSILDHSLFANYVDDRHEIMEEIVNKVPVTRNDRAVKAKLTKLWRAAENSEKLSDQNRQHGGPADNLEDPLPEKVLQSLLDRFSRTYGGLKPSGDELLCAHLLGRLNREIERGTHTVVTVLRVRTFREGNRSAQARRIKLGETLSLTMSGADVERGPREVALNPTYVQLLNVLFEGGYAVVGNFETKKGSKWAHLQQCRDYCNYVRNKACPLDEAHPALGKVIKADEDTRALFADSMRGGMSLGEAMDANRSRMEAIWLWACGKEAADARADLKDQGPRRGDKRQRSRTPLARDRRRPFSPPRRQPSPGADLPRAREGGIVDKTKKGVEICRKYNLNQCSGKCPHKRVHICNYRASTGNACGATSHTRIDAHGGGGKSGGARK